MEILPTINERGITTAIGLPRSEPVLEVIARLALIGPVQVIVGGNRFDVHKLARVIRRHTVQLDETLERIQQARPFTCYQAITLLSDTQPTTPLIAIDLLATFYDESISDAESVRLVNMVVMHLQRLGQQAPVLVTLRPSATRPGLSKRIQDIADDIYTFDTPAESFQPTLF